MPTVLRLQGIKRKRWADVFNDLRYLENEALTVIREQSEEQAKAVKK